MLKRISANEDALARYRPARGTTWQGGSHPEARDRAAVRAHPQCV